MIIRGASTISASYKMELYLALVLTPRAKRLKEILVHDFLCTLLKLLVHMCTMKKYAPCKIFSEIEQIQSRTHLVNDLSREI